jgi:hypothetical protein
MGSPDIGGQHSTPITFSRAEVDLERCPLRCIVIQRTQSLDTANRVRLPRLGLRDQSVLSYTRPRVSPMETIESLVQQLKSHDDGLIEFVFLLEPIFRANLNEPEAQRTRIATHQDNS